MTNFSSDFFVSNRRHLREALQPGVPIVLSANGLLQRNADNTFPFRQDSNFWYLTGLDDPDLILVIDGDVEYVMVPGRSGSREAFDGAVNFEELQKISGVSEILAEEDGWQRLGSRLKEAEKVQTLAAPTPYIEQYGIYTNPARGRLVERLNHWQPDIELIDIREQLANLRCIKQPEELRAIKQAIAVTADGIKKITDPKKLALYTHEYQIENDLTTAFRTDEASGHSFSPIVASGNRAVVLHNIANSGQIQANGLVVIDVGAEVSNYAADITRTVAFGTPSKRQQEVYEAVKDAQSYALSLLKPGLLPKEYEASVEKYIGQKLVELGLIEEITHEAVRKYYPHAVSHFLGLDVHDVGDYTKPYEAGMVVTCEPGIYIPEEGIGVRIEDDVLITTDGYEVLSKDLPTSLTPYNA